MPEEIQGTGRPESPIIPIVTRSTPRRRSGTKTVRNGNNRIKSEGYTSRSATVKVVINKGSNAEPMSSDLALHPRGTPTAGPGATGEPAKLPRAHPPSARPCRIPACGQSTPCASFSIGIIQRDGARRGFPEARRPRRIPRNRRGFLLAHPEHGAVDGNRHRGRFLRHPLRLPDSIQSRFLHHIPGRTQGLNPFISPQLTRWRCRGWCCGRSFVCVHSAVVDQDRLVHEVGFPEFSCSRQGLSFG